MDKVSIHAPVRGATQPLQRIVWIDRVSIHAPVRGATAPVVLVMSDTIVSIHAPVRGATRIAYTVVPLVWFQSTPLCEGRPFSRKARLKRSMFQSTPLCEGRLRP